MPRIPYVSQDTQEPADVVAACNMTSRFLVARGDRAGVSHDKPGGQRCYWLASASLIRPSSSAGETSPSRR